MGLKKLIENNQRQIKARLSIVDKIDELGQTYSLLSDEELKNKTFEFKERLQRGEKLNDLLVEAFATIREADKRVLGLYPYRVQILGGIVLHEGNLAEMRTGEGKTLTETMPVYLNALEGKGVHVVTVNEYLAQRDSLEMGQVYEWLGLSVGLNTSEKTPLEKKEAYSADITYSTNSELGFDYLRDNMALYPKDKVQRSSKNGFLNYCIVDEADSILIDEARTPLQIANEEKPALNLFERADKFAKTLDPDDYQVDLETKTISLLESGADKASKFFGLKNIYGYNSYSEAHYVEEALKANYTMERDKDYVVKDGKIMIVDPFTGRVMDGRRYSDGLHQAIEAKENCEVNDGSRTIASITYQNFFRMYKKVSGMSGTAKSSSEELYDNYHLEVVTIPTNKPIARIDHPDLIYPTMQAKYQAIIERVKEIHKTKQPILVGTGSVNSSEILSDLLKEAGIEHDILNAKNDKAEAEIIARAGELGAVTIATNMAGRGTDIKLGLGSKVQGGLYVIGTEHFESQRIDDQLRGRAGRQGDPGDSIFFASLEDELIIRYGAEGLQKIKNTLIKQNEEFKPIKSRLISRSVLNAQRRVEGTYYDERKNTLRYDDILREEREQLYSDRDKVLNIQDNMDTYIKAIFARTISNNVDFYYQDQSIKNMNGLMIFLQDTLGLSDLDKDSLARLSPLELKKELLGIALREMERKAQSLYDPELISNFQRIVVLKAIDANWKENIDNMEQLRMTITFRQYGQYNPLVEYQKQANIMYSKMLAHIEKDVTRAYMKAIVRIKDKQLNEEK
ncbi:preprotein translocase subunit SecA (plasmid) [Lactobacillus sp. PV037]|uniref:preprotein translocase subunit SecA n=1 Tax=Lactobacillus sp. PV037 TaxID=2594496 RepID=UPI002240C6B1|nr:preprotein translocase subunit SecA [Lactobacillus sp. PV037]QNQ82979.1 preprotein translocase subunit SecA [Lactobacillus sp. PV037]